MKSLAFKARSKPVLIQKPVSSSNERLTNQAEWISWFVSHHNRIEPNSEINIEKTGLVVTNVCLSGRQMLV